MSVQRPAKSVLWFADCSRVRFTYRRYDTALNNYFLLRALRVLRGYPVLIFLPSFRHIRSSNRPIYGRFRSFAAVAIVCNFNRETALMRFAPARVLVLFAMTTASSVHAQSQAGLQLIGNAGAVAAVTQSTEVDIEVTGLLARTTVTQRFTNHTDGWAEGRYVFPLPEGAAVDDLRVTIGDRVIAGEVREKRDARQVFRRAREQGRSAGLVEQHRANLFSTTLTNIAPGEDMEVRIGFGHTVAYEHGRFRLRFPTTTLARYANDSNGDSSHATVPAVPAPHHDRAAPPRLNLSVELHAGLALSVIESLHHPVRIRGSGSDRTIKLSDPASAAGRDFELVWTARDEDRLQGALFVETMLDRPHALLMLVPPHEFRPMALRRELILVIDRSGSMQGDAFEQARAAVRLALDRLDRDDRFNVIAFSDHALPLFDGPVNANRTNLARAYRFIDRLDAAGGTEIDAAIGMAMAGRPDVGNNREKNREYLRQIVFATDGAVANEKQVLEHIDRDIGDSRLFAVGIGHGVNDAFLSRATRRGRGTSTLIQDPRDIAGRMNALLMQLESPVLEDLKIDWPVTAETWPERMPDLYAGQPLMVLARLEVPEEDFDAGRVRATGFRDLRFVEMEWPLEHFQSAPGVARAWAQARIEGLADRPAHSMDAWHDAWHDDWHDNQLRHDERLLTALDYRIVSPLTSLLAVDRTPRLSEAARLARTAVAGAAPADRDARALTAMPATDAGAVEALLRGISILAIVLLLVLNRRFNRLEKARRRIHAEAGEQP
jgi:Ca-activated chloride channel homolog